MSFEIKLVDISPWYLYPSSRNWKGCWIFTVYRC